MQCSPYVHKINMQSKRQTFGMMHWHAQVLHQPHVMHSLAISLPHTLHSLIAIPLCQLQKRYGPHLIQAKPSQAMQNRCPCNAQTPSIQTLATGNLPVSEFPIFVHRLDCPIKFLAQRLGEELFDWHVKSLREDHCKTRVYVILRASVSITPNALPRKHLQS